MKGYIPGRRSGGIRRDVAASSELEQELQEEFAMDFTPDELHEFLAADLMEVPADPDFKERLRNKLWSLVRERYGQTAAPEPQIRRKGEH